MNCFWLFCSQIWLWTWTTEQTFRELFCVCLLCGNKTGRKNNSTLNQHIFTQRCKHIWLSLLSHQGAARGISECLFIYFIIWIQRCSTDWAAYSMSPQNLLAPVELFMKHRILIWCINITFVQAYILLQNTMAENLLIFHMTAVVYLQAWAI